MHACTEFRARTLPDPKRATRTDVEATGGLSRAVMDVGRLKFCEIPASPPACRRYFQPFLALPYAGVKMREPDELSEVVAECLI